jgi:hypothetical protein
MMISISRDLAQRYLDARDASRRVLEDAMKDKSADDLKTGVPVSDRAILDACVAVEEELEKALRAALAVS